MAKAAEQVPGVDFPFTNWDINTMERTIADGVVYIVHYTVTRFEDGEQAGAYGSIGLEPPDPDSLIPYADLDKATVVGWVKANFGDEKVAEIEAALSTAIQEKLHPVKTTGVPW